MDFKKEYIQRTKTEEGKPFILHLSELSENKPLPHAVCGQAVGAYGNLMGNNIRAIEATLNGYIRQNQNVCSECLKEITKRIKI